MPLLLRLGQHTLKGSLGGPRSLCRADRSMESSRRIHRVAWNKIPMQLMPAILMEGPDCRIDAARGTESICRSWGSNRSLLQDRSVVEINRIPRRRVEDNAPMSAAWACRSGRPMLLLQLWHSPQSIRIDLWVLEDNPDPMEGSDLLCNRRGVL